MPDLSKHDSKVSASGVKIEVFAPHAEDGDFKMMKQRTRAMSEKLCVICMDKSIESVCVPCGHRCLCMDCSVEILKKKPSKCPICAQNVTQIIKTYGV